MLIANGQGTKWTRMRVHFALPAFSRLQSYLWPRLGILLRTKRKVYQAVLRLILLCGGGMCPVRVVNESVLVFFADDRIRRILRVRCNDCSQMLTCSSTPILNVYRRISPNEGYAGFVTLRDVLRVN